jgi:hypothetical protein
MPFDPSRLLTQLQNTGLQNKDFQLFQLLSQMIRVLGSLSSGSGSGSGGGGGGGTINNITQIIGLMGEEGPSGEDGPPGTGKDGIDGANGMVPYFIASDETFTVPEFKQALFSMNIDNEGILEVDGFLIEVD